MHERGTAKAVLFSWTEKIMRDFAKHFYKTAGWKKTRKAYASSKGGLCERCLKAGRITPGEIVHHTIHLTPENINDERVTLDWNNLELLCRDCHGKEHARKKRYTIAPDGRVLINET